MVKVIIKKSCFEAPCPFISKPQWGSLVNPCSSVRIKPAAAEGSAKEWQNGSGKQKIWGKRKIQRVASLCFVTKRLWERLDASLNCSSRNFFKPAKCPRTQLVSHPILEYFHLVLGGSVMCTWLLSIGQFPWLLIPEYLVTQWGWELLLLSLAEAVSAGPLSPQQWICSGKGCDAAHGLTVLHSSVINTSDFCIPAFSQGICVCTEASHTYLLLRWNNN